MTPHSPRREFLLFLITGGIAALVNVVSRVGFSQLLRFELAVLLAYGVGMITAYVLARKFVFLQSRTSVSRSIAAFALVNCRVANLAGERSAQRLLPFRDRGTARPDRPRHRRGGAGAEQLLRPQTHLLPPAPMSGSPTPPRRARRRLRFRWHPARWRPLLILHSLVRSPWGAGGWTLLLPALLLWKSGLRSTAWFKQVFLRVLLTPAMQGPAPQRQHLLRQLAHALWSGCGRKPWPAWSGIAKKATGW